jgi:hypothetical protein
MDENLTDLQKQNLEHFAKTRSLTGKLLRELLLGLIALIVVGLLSGNGLLVGGLAIALIVVEFFLMSSRVVKLLQADKAAAKKPE